MARRCGSGGKVGREEGKEGREEGGKRKKEKGKRENTYGCARQITERRQPHKQDVGAAEGPAPGRLRRRWRRRPMAVRGEQRVLAGVVVGAAVALLVLVRRAGLCPPGGGERVEHGNEACAHARRGRRRRQAGRQARRGEARRGLGWVRRSRTARVSSERRSVGARMRAMDGREGRLVEDGEYGN